MARPITSSYTRALDTLMVRFKERHDSTNTLHKDLQIRLNDISGQMKALETIRQNHDPRPVGDTYQMHVGRAASRLRYLAEEASAAVTSKAQEAERSFDAALREHGGFKPGPYAVEIRQRIHALSPAEKVRVIQSLIEARDGSSLAALDGPSILTGLSASDVAKYREQYFSSVVPEIIKSRDVFRDLVSHIQTAVQTSLAAAAEYSDDRKLRELEEREAAAAKATDTLKGPQ